MNLIIRKEVWEKYYKTARTSSRYFAEGGLQNHKGVIQVLVTKLDHLPAETQAIDVRSRDFQ